MRSIKQKNLFAFNNGVAASLLGCIIVLAGVAGCSETNPYAVVPVKGKLTMGGQAIGGVRLTFTPKEGRPSIATTNESGEFEPWYRGTQNGVQTGTHRVTVEKAEPDDLMGAGVKPSKKLQQLMDRFGPAGSEEFTVEIVKATEELVVDLPAK